MNQYLIKGFIAGCLGAVILVIIMCILQAIGLGEPGFIAMYHAKFGSHSSSDQFIAALLFIISGERPDIISVFRLKGFYMVHNFITVRTSLFYN